MGGRQPVVSNEQILRVLIDSPDPIMSASEVAEGLPIEQAGTYKRLRALEDSGMVRSKKVGQGRAWWVAGTQWTKPDFEDVEPAEDGG